MTDKDYPWTTRLPTPVVIAISILSGGTALFLLGMHLSIWVWRRGARGWTMLVNLALLAAIYILPDPTRRAMNPAYLYLEVAAMLALITIPLILRYEVQQLFRTRLSREIEMRWLPTLLLHSGYINYCLTLERRSSIVPTDR